jgi:hypothetical protein
MTYKQQLFPWCIIRPFPNMRTQIVGRFRRRSDAEGHLQVLKQIIPGIPYEIMFDITPEDIESEDLTPSTSLPCKGKGKPDSNSPLRAGEGLTGRSTEE